MYKNQEIENGTRNNTEFLLSDLSRKIAKEFSLSQKESEELVNSSRIDTKSELEAKLNSFKTKWENIVYKKEENLEKLLFMLKEARKQVEELKNSQENLVRYESEYLRYELKNTLNWNESKKDTQRGGKSFIEKQFSTKMVMDFKNPNNFHQHLGWFCLWIANSSEACFKLWKDIFIWIAKAPIDIYALAKREAVYERNV